MVGAFIEIYMINQHEVHRKLENYYLKENQEVALAFEKNNVY